MLDECLELRDPVSRARARLPGGHGCRRRCLPPSSCGDRADQNKMENDHRSLQTNTATNDVESIMSVRVLLVAFFSSSSP